MLPVLQFLDRHVTGIDIDPESLEIASSNAEYLEVLYFHFMYECRSIVFIALVILVDLLKIAVGNGLGSV